MPLNDLQKTVNNSTISYLVELLKTETTAAHQAKIIHDLETFINTNDIILDNLLEGVFVEKYRMEMSNLYTIVEQAIRNPAYNLNTELNKWQQSLRQKSTPAAVAPTVLQSSMSVDLLVRGYVPAYKWGTDTDVLQCLGNERTEPEAIAGPGVYITEPFNLEPRRRVLLEENPEIEILSKALQEVIRKSIAGNVTLCVPVICANNHWRLAKITIQAGNITQAELLDSLRGDNGRNDPPLLNLEKIIKGVQPGCNVRPTLNFLGVQTNGFSCMDFTLQRALATKYQTTRPTNATTQAIIDAGQDAPALRIAIVKKICSQNRVLNENGVADRLSYHEGRVVGNAVPEANIETMTDSQLRSKMEAYFLTEGKEDQEKFDRIYATRLNELQREISDSELDTRALREAYQEYNRGNQFSQKIDKFFAKQRSQESENKSHISSRRPR